MEDIKGLPGGTKLPSRPSLSKKYMVSRTTVDKAISELIGEGYLYALDGSGTYVSQTADGQHENGHSVASWGVIVPDIRSDTYPGILRGIEDVANAHGINIVLCNSDNNEEKQAAYLSKLIYSRVSGVIMVPALLPKTELGIFDCLREAGIPLVFCNRAVEGVEAPRVLSNNFYGAYQVTRHLLDNGYRRIGFITRNWYSTSLERFQGYLAALSEEGITHEETLSTFPVDDSGVIDEKVAIRTLVEERGVDSVFCFNDAIAWSVFRELENTDNQVGKNFGVVGYDNTPICENMPVKLTSVNFKTHEIGREAAQLMLRLVDGETYLRNRIVLLQPSLEVRESSLKTHNSGDGWKET